MMTSEARMTTDANAPAPIRGSLKLSVSASSPQVTAKTDFSIFVIIQNPFDIPITIYNVQTHIPVELVDVNALRLEQAATDAQQPSFIRRVAQVLMRELIPGRFLRHTGIAIAVGTSFDPDQERDFVKMDTKVGDVGMNASIVGLQLVFPENPSAEELDRIFHRIADYRKGLVPVTLQPGDSVVRQFVLRTRRWLFFTPLAHAFQIQVDFSADGRDHAETISYQQSIRASLGAMAVGAGVGAVFGALLKNLNTVRGDDAVPIIRAILTAIVASIAIVIAFARKTSAQPIVSIEDFWGGALIGFGAGFFGFEQFIDVVKPGGKITAG
jgi:hypothetical protein